MTIYEFWLLTDDGETLLQSGASAGYAIPADANFPPHSRLQVRIKAPSVVSVSPTIRASDDIGPPIVLGETVLGPAHYLPLGGDIAERGCINTAPFVRVHNDDLCLKWRVGGYWQQRPLAWFERVMWRLFARTPQP